MFGKEGEGTTGQGSLNSILGQGCKVNGDIELNGTIRIDGEFEGTIKCPDTLIIGKSGVLKANVTVKNAIIGGKLIGNIEAENKIELQSGSHVQGDIVTSRLVIDEGVYFDGNCKMGGKSSGPSQSATSSDSSHKQDKPHLSNEKDRKGETVGAR